MDEQVVWVKGFVPRLKPKLQYPYVAVDIPVTVHVAELSEASVAARVTLAARRPQDAPTFDVLEMDGKLWRPIQWTRHFREDGLTAEQVLVRNERDNPLAKPAGLFYKQPADPQSPQATAAEPDPQALAVLTAEVGMAAEGVRIIGGVAHRECAEPTYVVTPARYRDSGVLLQPYCGVPGRTSDAAWFSSVRLEHARAFAAEEAARLGVDVVERGSIEMGYYAPCFDDVRFAEDRVIDAFAHVSRVLGGTVPEEAMDLSSEARAHEVSDRSHAVSLALRCADALAAAAERPDVAALLDATRMARSQVSYFCRNAVFSDTDDSILDGLSLPIR